MSTEHDDEWHPADLARRYCITLATLDRWIRTGDFPDPRRTHSGHRYWKDSEIKRWESGRPVVLQRQLNLNLGESE